MKAPIWDYGEAADKYVGDIWQVGPHLTKGCNVLDIGANKGLVTALCAINGAYVTSYECNPHAYKYLLQTIQSNSIIDRVVPIQKAIWTYTGHVKMDMKKASIQYANSLVVDRADRAYFDAGCSDWNIEVPCVSFEEAIGDTEWDIVKMDIEGAEFSVLAECPESVFEKIKYLTVEFHNYKGTERPDLIARLKKWFHVDEQVGVYCTRK